MKLYYSKGACSLAVRIIINELNLKCEYVAVDLKAKKLASGEDYLTINAKGAVPALETPHGILTENQVIQQYLVDSEKNHSLLPPVPYFKRYRTLEVLNYVSSDIHKSFGPLFNPQFPEAIKNDVILPMLVKKFAFINKLVGDKKYVMGEDFTLPDAYLFVVLRWADKMKVDLSQQTNLTRYYEGLKARDSIKKSCEEEGL